MMSDTIIKSVEGQVGIIKLNRPERFNSFNREMALAVQDALQSFATDNNIRCIYITGNGRAFSAGQDISELTGEHAIGIDKILTEHFNPIVKMIRSIQKPVVAAVNGVAAGAGANIALCCDIVVASVSASFIQAFSKIGLVPDSGGTYFLPKLIGFQKASALMMTGDKVGAEEAERLGMIYKYFGEADFEIESKKIAVNLAAMPTRGLAFTKQVLNTSLTAGFEDQLNAEDEFQRKAVSTKDYIEGINAFLEKRPPNFTGE